MSYMDGGNGTRSQKRRGNRSSASWTFILAVISLLFTIATFIGTAAPDTENGPAVSYRLFSEIDGLTVKERLLVEVPSDTTRTLHLSLPTATDILYIKNICGELPYVVDADGRLEIYNLSSGQDDDNIEVEVGMTSKDRIATKQGSVLEYTLIFSPPIQNTTTTTTLAKFEHLLKLPAGSRITMVVPQARILEEKDGKKSSILWKTNTAAGQQVFLARFERSAGWTSRLWGYMIAAVALLAAGRLSFAAFKEYRKWKLVSSLGLLDEKEEKVLALVVETGGTLQSELLKSTQYTKSNLSKIVSRLVSRGLLAKKKNGKIQRVMPGPNLPL